jgi:hypothetical protein
MTAHRIVTLARCCASLVAVWLALSTSGSFARDFVSDHLAGPAVLVHGTGAAGTLNVVILGDGFTTSQMEQLLGRGRPPGERSGWRLSHLRLSRARSRSIAST